MDQQHNGHIKIHSSLAVLKYTSSFMRKLVLYSACNNDFFSVINVLGQVPKLCDVCASNMALRQVNQRGIKAICAICF
jgi:hypothetical protein